MTDGISRIEVLKGSSPEDLTSKVNEFLKKNNGVVKQFQHNGDSYWAYVEYHKVEEIKVENEFLELPIQQARERFEKAYICNLLKRTDGNIAETARRSGMGRPGMSEKIKKLGIDPNSYRRF